MRTWILILILAATAATARAQTAAIALDTRVPLVTTDTSSYGRRGPPFRAMFLSMERKPGGSRWGITMARAGAGRKTPDGFEPEYGAFTLAFALDWPLLQAGSVAVRWGVEVGMLWVGSDGNCNEPFCGLPAMSATAAPAVRAAMPLSGPTAAFAEAR